MLRLLTLLPILIAAALTACGPGVSGGDRSSVGRYAGEVLGTAGLVFYARMDEEQGSVSDFFGRAIGIPEGLPFYRVQGGMQNSGNGGEDQPNLAIDFTGANVCFNLGQVDTLRLQRSRGFTIMFMAYGNAAGPYQVIGSWDSVGFQEWKVFLTAGSQIAFQWTPNGSGGTTATFGSYTATWDHYAVTVNAVGDVTGFQNGSQVNFLPNNVFSEIYTGAQNDIRIGCNVTGEYMNGGLDEIAVYNRVLSHEDIIRINLARQN